MLTIELGEVSTAVDLQRTGHLTWLDAVVPAEIGQLGPSTLRLILESGSGLDFTKPAKTKKISVTLSVR
jgi:hypothetical protein